MINVQQSFPSGNIRNVASSVASVLLARDILTTSNKIKSRIKTCFAFPDAASCRVGQTTLQLESEARVIIRLGRSWASTQIFNSIGKRAKDNFCIFASCFAAALYLISLGRFLRLLTEPHLVWYFANLLSHSSKLSAQTKKNKPRNILSNVAFIVCCS